MDRIYNYFMERFQDSVNSQDYNQRRIGAELKFPLVNPDGTAASFETVCKLWDYLRSLGWRPVKDKMTEQVIGAKKPGQHNDTFAGCETGFCKTEFSLSHVANLFELKRQIDELRIGLKPFCERNNVYFLGYGVQPVTPPNRKLMMKKGRTSPWVKAFGSNRHVPKKDGDDVHLLTLNAASHVHVNVSLEEVVDAVNVFNGFAGAQLALTANSNIWQGRIDPNYKCVAEKFWDWWMLDTNRIGVPPKPFKDIKDYVRTVANFRPIYVIRNGKPIILQKYQTFHEYYRTGRAIGLDSKEREVSFVPQKSDIDLHNSCYWYNARISRYYTVENRVNDQQPSSDLLCVSALTLGLVSALPEAVKEVSGYEWGMLRKIRDVACRHGLRGELGEVQLNKLALRMLFIARQGLIQRGFGEEEFLRPLEERLCKLTCPADRARHLFQNGGIKSLVEKRKI